MKVHRWTAVYDRNAWTIKNKGTDTSPVRYWPAKLGNVTWSDTPVKPAKVEKVTVLFED